MDLGIAGRKAIVCASSKGLGKGCARALAEAGCEVVMNGRNADVLEAAAKEIAAATGAKITPVACDVGTEDGRKALLSACPAPDILVNNNGGPPPKDFRQISREEMIAGLDANMMTPIILVQSVIDGMAERGFGRIVNISSVAARGGLARQVGYSATKAGLLGLTHTVALEYARKGVTCNAVLPGMVETENVKAMPQEIRDAAIAATPVRRFGEPEEIAALVVFLCGDEAGYITGAEIDISGGGHLNTIALGSRKDISGR
ncbi:MAG: SDR family oxidoreductase [Methylobacteriaceae bacterium]|nr:SDR family oxidoreductase [Methylobacteriaceae bacterium]